MRTIQEDFREFVHLDRKRTTDGLTTVEFKRWQILHYRLDKAFAGRPPPGDAEQRASLRLPTRLRVTYDGLGGEGGTMVNLSRGGCFVRTDLPAPIGTRLTLIVDAANVGETLEIDGEVVSVSLRQVGRGRGMGIRFDAMTPEVAKKLSDLYEQILSFFAFGS
ncbi:MAG TPA: PilZ domain-containing protein [Myxococcota bacterium]|nr:PilZ domain-containing protein [Myxococcota bacterium]